MNEDITLSTRLMLAVAIWALVMMLIRPGYLWGVLDALMAPKGRPSREGRPMFVVVVEEPMRQETSDEPR